MADIFSPADPDPPAHVTVAIILTCLLFLLPVSLYVYISLVPSHTENLFLAIGGLNDGDDEEGQKESQDKAAADNHDSTSATSPTSPTSLITPSSVSETKALVPNRKQPLEPASITNCPKAYVSFRNIRLYIVEKVKPVKRQQSSSTITSPESQRRWFKFKSNKIGVTNNQDVEDIVAAAAKSLALKSARLIDEDPQRAPTPTLEPPISLPMAPALPADDKPAEKRPRKPRPKFFRRQLLKDVSGFAMVIILLVCFQG
jgi:hypothetical protein